MVLGMDLDESALRVYRQNHAHPAERHNAAACGLVRCVDDNSYETPFDFSSEIRVNRSYQTVVIRITPSVILNSTDCRE